MTDELSRLDADIKEINADIDPDAPFPENAWVGWRAKFGGGIWWGYVRSSRVQPDGDVHYMVQQIKRSWQGPGGREIPVEGHLIGDLTASEHKLFLLDGLPDWGAIHPPPR